MVLDLKSPTEIFNINIKNIFLILFLFILANVVIIKIFDFYSITILVMLNIFILTSIILYFFKFNLNTILLSFCILPLAYVSDSVHQNLNLMYLLDLPVFIFLFIYLLYKFYYSDFQNSPTYIGKTVAALFIFAIFQTAWGFSNGGKLYIISNELLHYLYYFCFFPIIYFLKNDWKWKFLWKLFLIICVFVSVVYFFVNIRIDGRFTTYNNAFLPLASGIFFAIILYNRNNKKLVFLSAFSLFIIFVGSFYTQTRILWVCLLLTLIIVSIFYYKKKSKLFSLKSIILLLMLVVIPIIGITKYAPKPKEITTSKQTEERLGSISNPMADVSFLMRVEISYYAIQKFLESPIIGEGFGKTLPLKIFIETEYVHPDNSWLYFLWKGGIIGFLLFSWMYYRFFKLAFKTLNLIDSPIHKSIILGTIAGQFAFIFYGLFSANLIGYKINFLSAFSFAYIEYLNINISEKRDVAVK